MTLEEAIEWSGTAAHDMEIQNMPRFVEAVRLGIEALKRIGSNRTAEFPLDYSPLPGETEK